MWRSQRNIRLIGWTFANWARNPRHVHREMLWREMLWKDACREELRTEKKMLWDFVFDYIVMWANAIILQEHVGDQACIFTHCIVTVIVYWESLVNDLEHCVLILSDFPEAWIFLNKNTISTAGWSQIQLPGSHFEAQSCKKIHGGNCSSGAIEVDTWHQCTFAIVKVKVTLMFFQ